MYALGIMLMQSYSQSFHSHLTQDLSNYYINNLTEKTLTENFNFFLFLFSLAFSITIEGKLLPHVFYNLD